MSFKRLFFISTIIIFISFQSNAQVLKNFSKDKTFFIDELKGMFNNDKTLDNDKKKDAEVLLNDFQQLWNNNLDATQRDEIYKMSNLMLKYRQRPYPNFYKFFSTVISFRKSKQDDKSFGAWIKGIQSLMSVKNSHFFDPFLETTNNLINNNILYKSPSTLWYSSNSNFFFDNDSILKVVFPSSTLICNANKDSSVINDTKGVFYPLTNNWVGQTGKITWERAGFNADVVYVDLNNYEINLKYSRFNADSVTFYNKNYFANPLMGSFQEKVLVNLDEDKASYPRFNSYDKRIRINELFPNVDYEGGFAMQGARLMGFGDVTQDAYVYFKKDGKNFVTTAAKDYTIRKDRISSMLTAVNIYFEGDSIYHPGLEMKYMNDFKELTLLRGLSDLTGSPFVDSYHKIDLYCENLFWKTTESKIKFGTQPVPGRTNEANFESFNYYAQYRYDKLQGIDEINPLNRVKRYCDTYKTREFTVNDMSKQMRIAPEEVKAMLIRLANMGFLIYSSADEKITVKDKVFEYLKAMNKKTDYDALLFHSTVTNDTNAVLSLLTFDLKINGVPSILLSDSQKVFVYPLRQQIVMKKNRDFVFSGLVIAGRFALFTKNTTFLYDDFKLDLPVIDSLSFKVPSFEPNESGDRPLRIVQNVIQDLKGELLIDSPKNKAGLKQFPKFPYLRTKEDSYVYYDRKFIQKGAYTKDRFYYHILPFEIDSLDNFQTEKLKFDGSLTSAGIFPEIQEPLKVQPDYSLGFVTTTPAGGLPAYGGRGNYQNKIDLSNLGLRGDGTLEYITSTSVSNKIVFTPDSMSAFVQSFDVKEQVAGTEYPQVNAANIKEQWIPYKDLMSLYNTETPFVMYNKESSLSGSLALSHDGLSGKGTMAFEKAEMDANLYKFKQHLFDSDTANFRLKSIDLTDLAFKTENYKSHIDFKKRTGEFTSNGGVSKVNFPINRYVCFMDRLDWEMDKDEIALRNTKKTTEADLDKMSLKELVSADLPGSDFISSHPAQDYLSFRSPKALFSLKDYVLKAEEVRLIKVADAAIAPGDGIVTILRQAEMLPLANATILADTLKKYHYIYNAIATILGRKNYTGAGKYDYTDETGTKYPIMFDKISVTSEYRTTAHGYISDSNDFVLSPAFDFTGDVTLTSAKQHLNFNGGARINKLCNQTQPAWLKFNADINPKKIYIPIGGDPKDINGRKLASSVLYSNTGGTIYTCFVAPRMSYSDTSIVSASGFLTFDNLSKEYRIASKVKLNNLDTLGNMVALSTINCMTRGEGNLNLGSKFGQVKMATFGYVSNSIMTNEANFDMVMPMNFLFHDESMKMMSQSMYTNNTLTGMSGDYEIKYKKALEEILGEEDANKVVNEINLYGTLKKIPEKLNYTLLLSDIKMKWDSVTRSFVSTGNIGVGSIGKTQINKYVKGYMQIIKKRSGDAFNLYFELDDKEWYFFSYANNMMMGLSSIKEFNDFIIKEKPDKRRLDAGGGLPSYSYYISSERKKDKFLETMKSAGAGDNGTEPDAPEPKTE
ncbi:MAG: hypothetical protein WCL51_15020 [Bacteroidota bacterium]